MRKHFLDKFANVSWDKLGDVLLDVENFLQIRKSIPREGVQMILDEHQ